MDLAASDYMIPEMDPNYLSGALGEDFEIVDLTPEEVEEIRKGTRIPLGVKVLWGVAGTVSMAAGAYHGYKRNQSVGWALWWALMGSTFPVLTPAIALAQGFGQRR